MTKHMHYMKLAVLLMVFTVLHAVENVVWYKNITPFSSRDAVIAAAGKPEYVENGKDIYTQPHGKVVVSYQDGIIIDCTHLDPGDGVSMNYYHMYNGVTSENSSVTVAEFIKNDQFQVVPSIVGNFVRTYAVEGACYKTETGFLSVVPIVSLMGGIGFFSDKVGMVVDFKGKEQKILYNAFDNWVKLKPPGITQDEVLRRKIILSKKTEYKSAALLTEALGKADSHMGSGIDYKIYYVDNGLLILSDFSRMEELALVKPGK